MAPRRGPRQFGGGELLKPALTTVVRTDPANGAVVTYLGGRIWPNHSAGLAHSIQRDAAADIWRFEVNAGEAAYFDNSATRNRSEISDQFGTVAFGVDVWQAMELWIEPGSVGLGNPIMSQWHDTGDAGDAGGMPPVSAIFWDGTSLREQRAWQRANPYPGTFEGASNSVIGVPKLGRWHRIVKRMKFAAAVDNSEVDVWFDGVQTVTYRGPVGTPNIEGNYVKIGIYRDAAVGRCAVRYHRFEWSLSSLLSRNDEPMPAWRA
jgi:hypothetical protein